MVSKLHGGPRPELVVSCDKQGIEDKGKGIEDESCQFFQEAEDIGKRKTLLPYNFVLSF